VNVGPNVSIIRAFGNPSKGSEIGARRRSPEGNLESVGSNRAISLLCKLDAFVST
jgi:hypothetical protein